MKALTERQASWMRDTRKIVLALLFTIALFGAIAITTRNYFVREMLVFVGGLGALLVVGVLFANLFIFLQEVWAQTTSLAKSCIKRISARRHPFYGQPSPNAATLRIRWASRRNPNEVHQIGPQL